MTPLHASTQPQQHVGPPHANNLQESKHAHLNSTINFLNLGHHHLPSAPPNSLASHVSSPFVSPHQSQTSDIPAPQPQRQNPSNPAPDSTFSTKLPWLPPVSTDLRWIWVGQDGPFITNGEFREQRQTSFDSETQSDSLTVLKIFNLDSINETRPEVMPGATWRHGQIS